MTQGALAESEPALARRVPAGTPAHPVWTVEVSGADS